MKEHPVAADPARQQHGVLVLGRHHHPQPLERLEVGRSGPTRRPGPRGRTPCRRRSSGRARRRRSRADPRGPIPPRGACRRSQRRAGRRRPSSTSPSARARAGQVREAAAVLDAAEQHRLVADRASRPAFITALTVYGQRSGASSGLPGWRVKRDALSVTEDAFVDVEVVVDHAVGGEAALGRAGGTRRGRSAPARSHAGDRRVDAVARARR